MVFGTGSTRRPRLPDEKWAKRSKCSLTPLSAAHTGKPTRGKHQVAVPDIAQPPQAPAEAPAKSATGLGGAATPKQNNLEAVHLLRRVFHGGHGTASADRGLPDLDAWHDVVCQPQACMQLLACSRGVGEPHAFNYRRKDWRMCWDSWARDDA